MSVATGDFFISGGTLPTSALSYVEREADAQLFEALQRGEFCYVLTSRQMGKSSLMIRTAVRLRETGTRAVVVDLTAIGQNLTPSQWYRGILSLAGQQLGLEPEMESCWRAHGELGPVQRLLEVLRQVALQDENRSLVLFIDEIDALRSLPFPGDEFLAAIRECFNRRAQEPELRNLSFCLLGVAAPSDLIRDTSRTPFNIGRRIELRDFTAREASILSVGLALGAPHAALRTKEVAQRLLQRVLWWTGGHPYLTQRLCQEASVEAQLDRATIDRLCRSLFLSSGARERDDNLVFVRERLVRPVAGGRSTDEEVAALLHHYGRVRGGKYVRDEETDARVTTLRLSGIVSSDGNRLRVRNRIYRQVFDGEWIAIHMPHAELRRQREAYRRGLFRTAAVSGTVLSVVTGLAAYAFRSASVAHELGLQATQLASERQIALDDARQLLYATGIQAAWKAVDAGDHEHATDYLNREVPRSGKADLRGWEWYYLRSRCSQEIAVLRGYGGALAQAAFLNSERSLIAVDTHHQVVMRDAVRYAEQFAWKPPATPSTGVVLLSPDGSELLRAVGMRRERPFAADAPWEVRLVDRRRGTERVVLRQLGEVQWMSVCWPLRTVAFSRRKSGRLARQLYHLDSGRALPAPAGFRTAVIAALAPDAPLMGWTEPDGKVTVWNLARARVECTLPETTPAVSMRFELRSRQLLVRSKIWLSVWDLDSHLRERVPLPREWLVYAYSISPDKRLLAVSLGSASQAFAPSEVRVWDLQRHAEQPALRGYTGAMTSLQFSADSARLLTGGLDRSLRLWNVQDGFAVQKLLLPQPAIRQLVCSPNAANLITRGDDGVRVWRAADGASIEHLDMDAVGPFAVFPNGDRIAIASATGVVVRALGSRRMPEQRSPFHEDVVEVAVAPDGQAIGAVTQDGRLWIWKPDEGRYRELRPAGGAVLKLAYSPDSKSLAIASSDGYVRRIRLADGETEAPLISAGGASAVVYAPDGKTLAVVAGTKVRLWDLRGQKSLPLEGHYSKIRTVSFSPDSRTLVTADMDGVVKLWHAATGQEFGSLGARGGRGAGARAQFTSDGNAIAAVWRNGTALIWSVPRRRNGDS